MPHICARFADVDFPNSVLFVSSVVSFVPGTRPDSVVPRREASPYRSATRSSKSKNSGNEIAADSAPRMTVSPFARSPATANAMAMR